MPTTLTLTGPMKIVATIEARMRSSRLPGKVLKKISGSPALAHQVERLKRSRLINEIVLATTDNIADDSLEAFGKDLGLPVFRGSEKDVLGRILGAVRSVKGELHVQTTGDCPLLDPEIVDRIIQAFLDNVKNVDFVSNVMKRTYPVGLECRVFSAKILEEVDKLTNDPIDRVHGSTYIYTVPGRYRTLNIEAPEELRYPDWRWTLDTPEDLDFIRRVYSHFYSDKPNFTSLDIRDWLLENPDFVSINSSVRQKVICEG